MKKLKTSRIRRYQNFETFQKYAESSFQRIAERNQNHAFNADMYSFAVAPYGRFGKVDKRQCDVLYGAVPFDTITEAITLFAPPKSTTLVQEGPQLSYFRNDDGYIFCVLYPPSTKNRTAIEDSIILATRIDPIKLLNDRTLIKHFNYFSAYFECHNIDGEPTLVDRFRFFCVTTFYRQIVNGEVQNSRAKRYWLKSLEFTFNVGLSGIVLFAILKAFDIKS